VRDNKNQSLFEFYYEIYFISKIIMCILLKDLLLSLLEGINMLFQDLVVTKKINMLFVSIVSGRGELHVLRGGLNLQSQSSMHS
jgi:hypothetical protein